MLAKQSQIVLMQPVGAAVTFSELQSDVVIALAERTWGPSAPKSTPFDPQIVSRFYSSELARPRRSSSVALRRMQILELSQYLERYLWPHFEADTASPEHVMSIIMMVNEKFREGVPAWDAFVQPATADDGAAPAQGVLPVLLTQASVLSILLPPLQLPCLLRERQDLSAMVPFFVRGELLLVRFVRSIPRAGAAWVPDLASPACGTHSMPSKPCSIQSWAWPDRVPLALCGLRHHF